MLNSISYQNLILVGIMAVLLGIILIIMKTGDELTKLKAITATALMLAIMFIASYIILCRWNIPTGILMVVVIAIGCLIQNIIEKKASVKKKEEAEKLEIY